MTSAAPSLASATTETVLFHSALGLPRGICVSPKELRSPDDIAYIPELYDGEIFGDLTAGAAKRDVLDIPEICRRATA